MSREVIIEFKTKGWDKVLVVDGKEMSPEEFVDKYGDKWNKGKMDKNYDFVLKNSDWDKKSVQVTYEQSGSEVSLQIR